MELKDNCCKIKFICAEKEHNDCVYFVQAENINECKYISTYYCTSKVAQVNRMILTLKDLGITLD